MTEHTTNWDIIGHEWAIEFLRRSIAGGRAAHAYLISGPAQVGKALVALRLAQALNCELGGPDPCLACRTCKRIARGNHPDVRIAGLASQGAGLKAEEAARQRDLKIDTIREWQADINLRPYEAQRRIFILHDAERMSDSAANAMLKTLEEPPPYATLMLIANTAGDLLPTIVSRCQPLKLRPVPRTLLASELRQRQHLPPEDADLLAAWSGGRPGWALHMINAPEQLEARQNQLDELANLATQSRSDALRWAEEQAKLFRGGEQANVYSALEIWQGWWRDVLLTAAGCGDAVTHVDRRSELEQAAKRYTITNIHTLLVQINRTSQQLRENVNPQLAIENILLHLP
ncbi:MAG: DNA polymerase III subunit delta' [Roseiflexaceae bacterium]|nr:DNA polymerase III subunit delta' [Roseiflexaceae bacterium]